ncbi:MAG: CpsD/CapB family tyrosine-protein kinase [Eubacterium sp.]|nr:CpsD/CapB family tyrosine-protein kinase [Eubacterium sp.]MDE6156149.1 CpsD/CapB family tyrosine-protein kinase [Eubacterium sp.]MDE6767254.1 CpsD/CapB family tyrosine-protein kinase [Eubacterium sp.]
MAKKKNDKLSSAATSRLLLDKAPIQTALKFRIEEAYKTIRANIMFSVMKKGCKRIVVTSSVPGEGKTTTTVNLAVSISQTDQKVLLIDGDLRKPKIHQYFSVPNAPGLTNYLGDKISGKRTADLFSVIHPTEYENLCVLCSGSIPPNPAELLGSELMADFLDDVSQDFDYVIIDTPPVNVVSDCLPLIRESDGVLVVVRSNKSTHPELQRALSALEFIDAKILGFVVNFVESKAGKSNKGTYGSYGAYGNYNSYSSYSYSSYKYKSSYEPRN